MRRSILVFTAGFLLALIGTGVITEWPKLLRLMRSGVPARGLVVTYDGHSRGKAEIKVLGLAPPRVIEAFCVGFPCDPGSEVRIQMLPSDQSVFFVGDGLQSQFLFTSLLTFVLAPLSVGGGLLISFTRLSKSGVQGSPRVRVQLKFLRMLPVLMCLGLVVSTISSLVQHIAIGYYQTASVLFAVVGSIFYLAGVRLIQRSPLRAALTWGAFAIAVVTAVLDVSAPRR